MRGEKMRKTALAMIALAAGLSGCTLASPTLPELSSAEPLRILTRDAGFHLYGPSDASRIFGRPFDVTVSEPAFLTGKVTFEYQVQWEPVSNNVDIFQIKGLCDNAKFVANQCNIVARTTSTTQVPETLKATVDFGSGDYNSWAMANYGQTDVNGRFLIWVTVHN